MLISLLFSFAMTIFGGVAPADAGGTPFASAPVQSSDAGGTPFAATATTTTASDAGGTPFH